jgi:SAM-dependent MidA family methyltransferase
MPTVTLPTPSETALQYSHALQNAIRTRINAAGGWISFADFMEAALYTPGMGYYSAGAAKLGQAGDFVTAPEISSLFGKTIARQAAQVFELIGHNDILEFGAGSGKLALDLLLELEQRGCLPKRYFILEVSADLQQRQRELFEKYASHLVSSIHWLTCLPNEFNGLILANEVLDAMPVHLVVWQNHHVYERGVSCNQQAFEWQERPLIGGELFEIAQELIPFRDAMDHDSFRYASEISLATRHFMRSLAQILRQGVILLIDYGFGQTEYYHPQRSQGTLMCHYRHHAHDDPFYLPGLQDITSHVDFSAISRVALDSDLQLLGYTNQAHFLINCGITEILSRIPADNTHQYLPLANQLQRLVSPAEMGELFKVIAFGRQIDQSLMGFSRGDKSRLL